LEIGFSLSAITVARASGSILGLSGTIITPAAVSYLKKRHIRKLSPNEENGKEAEEVVTRTVGFWGLASQCICLVSFCAHCMERLLTPVDSGSHSTLERITKSNGSIRSIAPFSSHNHTFRFSLFIPHRPFRQLPHGAGIGPGRDTSVPKIYLRRRRAIF
jgi:hypothetical protein